MHAMHARRTITVGVAAEPHGLMAPWAQSDRLNRTHLKS